MMSDTPFHESVLPFIAVAPDCATLNHIVAIVATTHIPEKGRRAIWVAFAKSCGELGSDPMHEMFADLRANLDVELEDVQPGLELVGGATRS